MADIERGIYSIMGDLVLKAGYALRYATIVEDRVNSGPYALNYEPYLEMLEERINDTKALLDEAKAKLAEKRNRAMQEEVF